MAETMASETICSVTQASNADIASHTSNSPEAIARRPHSACATADEDALQRALEDHRQGRRVSLRLRKQLENRGWIEPCLDVHGPQPSTSPQASTSGESGLHETLSHTGYSQSSLMQPVVMHRRDVCTKPILKRTTSQHGTASTPSFCSLASNQTTSSSVSMLSDSSQDTAPSRTTSSISTRRTTSELSVHFSESDEVEEVHRFPMESLVGSSSEGTNWSQIADRRRSRFALIPQGGDLCSRGGAFEKEAIDALFGLKAVLAAWRRLTGIPDTVPNHIMHSGVDWPRQSRCISKRW